MGSPQRGENVRERRAASSVSPEAARRCAHSVWPRTGEWQVRSTRECGLAVCAAHSFCVYCGGAKSPFLGDPPWLVV